VRILPGVEVDEILIVNISRKLNVARDVPLLKIAHANILNSVEHHQPRPTAPTFFALHNAERGEMRRIDVASQRGSDIVRSPEESPSFAVGVVNAVYQQHKSLYRVHIMPEKISVCGKALHGGVSIPKHQRRNILAAGFFATKIVENRVIIVESGN
jgi:hypothetical protein